VYSNDLSQEDQVNSKLRQYFQSFMIIMMSSSLLLDGQRSVRT